MDTSGPLLIALYLRDLCALSGAGRPEISELQPRIRPVETRQLIDPVGGDQLLRFEWEQWWSQLLGVFPGGPPELTPPDFPGFAGNPALQRILQAHFGTALVWTRERIADYQIIAARRETMGDTALLSRLVQDRELELGRHAREFTLTMVELPLAEPRAWFLEPDRILLSQELLEDSEMFRSFVQPVVEMLV